MQHGARPLLSLVPTRQLSRTASKTRRARPLLADLWSHWIVQTEERRTRRSENRHVAYRDLPREVPTTQRFFCSPGGSRQNRSVRRAPVRRLIGCCPQRD